MTQKELAYFEDAVGHEVNIIELLSFMIKNLSDENLILFMENELNKHNKIKEKLINLLEVKSNE